MSGLSLWLTLLAQASPPGGPLEAEPTPPDMSFQMLLMMGIFAAIFYFIALRPQQQQEAERKAQLEALKKDDKVVINNGIFGVIANINGDEIVVRIDEKKDVKVKVLRSAISTVLKDGAPA